MSAWRESLAAPPAAPTGLLDQLEASRERLEEYERLADWWLDLNRRLWRAQIQFQICDVEAEHDDLAAEVHDLSRVVRTMAWSSRADRRAA
jgi:hypothetical protein